MTDTEARRRAFEACPPTNCDWGAFWLGWQAALDSVVVELPLFFVTGNEPCYYASDIDKAIHAAGVRTK